MDQGVLYKAFRIHVYSLPSRHWLSQIFSIGKRMPATQDSLTDTVIRVPGEYPSKDGAIQAARQYIDRLEGSE